jgi:predicted TIM-barrel fold metal-dependent hydrolase
VTDGVFRSVSTIDYPIIDCDGHVHEPAGLWQERVPGPLRDRAPKVIDSDRGQMWSFDGGRAMRQVPPTGWAPPNIDPLGATYETMRPGAFETKARLADMDADGVYAQVLYPTVTLSGAAIYSADDAALQRACVRAYNEWLLEICDASNGRLIPQAIMPTCGLDAMLDELSWSHDHGHRGVLISSYPNGTIDPDPEDDTFWHAVRERALPVGIHLGSFNSTEISRKPWNIREIPFLGLAAAGKSGKNAIGTALNLLFSGVPQKFPEVPIVLVEANVGWIPTMLEQTDDMFLRFRWFTGAVSAMPEMPSTMFHRSFWAGFLVDQIGVELRYHMNMNHLMWGSDYPHTASDWPHSRLTIERNFRGIPASEVRLFLHDNCKQLYRLDHIPATNAELASAGA